MTDIEDQAQQLVQQALAALSHHRDGEARNLARQAAQLAPDSENVWLVMAAVSSPHAAEIYLYKALEINPQSERAQKGLEWVKQHAQEKPVQPAAVTNAIENLQPEQPAQIPVSPEIEPIKPEGDAVPPEVSARDGANPAIPSIPAKKLYTRKVVLWPWILLIIALCLGTALWLLLPTYLNASAASLHANRTAGEIVKPSHTPTATATFTPLPTATRTPSPSPTPTKTATPLPTDTPAPVANDDPDYVYSSDDIPSVSKKERWIDVDLSSQTVTAYEGKEEVNSFLVSTGVSAHPTVTGRFHIYVKYRYTDMAGPGYYLPDVPYTMYFHEGYGLHGTYWHHNFGTPMSHGCVNLRTEDAAWLFDWAEVGTLVNVHE
jgi:lipoprotein-anchoring transpeptidase ErfK/SrfK